MKFDFTGQTVLITGATRGIGLHLANDLRELGARLLLTGTQTDELAELQKTAPTGERYLTGDFSSRDSIDRFVDSLAEFERIDVCINNAGINRIGPIDEIDPDDWEAVRTVNLDGPLLITRYVGGLMRRHRYGRIVNISSIFGVISRSQRALYSATKFGLRGLTTASALDLAEANVLVNAVAPGFVRTKLTERILGPAEMLRLTDLVPLKRLADPGDITSAIVFLSSNLNTYITAQTIIVDGGYTAI